jgi:hypothetical protein
MKGEKENLLDHDVVLLLPLASLHSCRAQLVAFGATNVKRGLL